MSEPTHDDSQRDIVQKLAQWLSDLEARIDALERPRKAAAAEAESASSDNPVATPLGLQHCGRSLFRVEGKSGVWCGKRDHDEYDTETVCARQAEKRGRPRMKRLYRLNALSEEMAAMFQQKAEQCNDN
jgi:hypothetical protein